MDEQPPNSALDVKLEYLGRDIREIKSDVKEIKADYVSRREFESKLAEINARVGLITKIIYAIGSVTGLAVLGAILKLVLIP